MNKKGKLPKEFQTDLEDMLRMMHSDMLEMFTDLAGGDKETRRKLAEGAGKLKNKLVEQAASIDSKGMIV